MVVARKKIESQNLNNWIEAIPVPVLLCAESGEIRAANLSAAELLGISAGIQVDENIVNLFSPRNSANEPNSKIDFENDPVEAITKAPVAKVHGQGEKLVSISVGDAGSPSGEKHYLLVLSELNQFQDDGATEQSDYDEHLRTMRHKLKSPLTGGMVLVDVLLRNPDKNLTSNQIRRLGDVKSSLNTLANMVGDI